MQKLYIYFLCNLLITLYNLEGYAQNEDIGSSAYKGMNRIEFFENTSTKLLFDVRVSNLMEAFNAEHKLNLALQGYRIELFSNSGENSRYRATQLKELFENKHLEIPAYVVWEYPNFELHIGNYRTKLEAERNLTILRDEYPFAFVTKSKIELPQLVIENKKAE
jgi:hypothetical protein